MCFWNCLIQNIKAYSYQYLKDIKINDHDKKLELPVHVILGVNDYTRIKTKERPRVGLPGELIAELKK